ncbi:hypothetical protein HispidOSU_027976 [Sigmodon hispidus]
MGKVRTLRARVHQATMKSDREAATSPVPRALEPALPKVSEGGAGAKDWTLVHNDIFARTQIDPSALVQRLELDQMSVVSLKRGTEPKTILPKKEKLKLRHERWLQKIEAIKLADKKLKEERRRRGHSGELQELEARRQQSTRSRVTSKPRPVELNRMSTAQRQQLLEEESTWFQELLASPSYRASSLLAIGRQLAHQMQLEGGEQL